jgi:hypothetical protein
MRPITVRRRLTPTAARAGLLLEAVSEVETIDEEALPPAHLAGHALSAILADAPTLELERVQLSVRGLAHAHLETRVAGAVAPLGDGHVRARARVVQRSGLVLEVEGLGHEGRSPGRPRPIPGELAAFARAVSADEDDYARLETWPTDFLVALCAAGVEAENESGLARLLRLSVELVQPAPLESGVHLAIDGVRPVAGDTARVVFRVTRGAGRLVARGDALIASALAHHPALAIPARLAA